MPSDRPASSSPSAAPAPARPAAGEPRVLRLLAPAKVNLHLRVGPPRADGFHPLLTWMCTASLFDTLTIQARPLGAVGERGEASPPHGPGQAGSAAPQRTTIPAAPSDAAAGAADDVTRGSGEITLTCDLPGLPCGADNLVVRVARAWQRRQAELRGTGASAGGGHSEAEHAAAAVAQSADGHDGVIARLDVALGKRIPVGAGLGGGSSDAARTLLALDRLSGTRLPAADLSAFAAQFGSDLSFFVYGGSAVCRGRGEQVMPTAAPVARWAVLVLPAESMPTPAVYRKFDEMGLGHVEPLSLEPNWAAWTRMCAKQLLPRLVNDLEAPAFAISPTLGALRADVEQLLGQPVRMSGSGSSLFTLYDAADEARRAAEAVAARFQQRAEAVELAANFADDLNGFAA